MRLMNTLSPQQNITAARYVAAVDALHYHYGLILTLKDRHSALDGLLREVNSFVIGGLSDGPAVKVYLSASNIGANKSEELMVLLKRYVDSAEHIMQVTEMQNDPEVGPLYRNEMGRVVVLTKAFCSGIDAALKSDLKLLRQVIIEYAPISAQDWILPLSERVRGRPSGMGDAQTLIAQMALDTRNTHGGTWSQTGDRLLPIIEQMATEGDATANTAYKLLSESVSPTKRMVSGSTLRPQSKTIKNQIEISFRSKNPFYCAKDHHVGQMFSIMTL